MLEYSANLPKFITVAASRATDYSVSLTGQCPSASAGLKIKIFSNSTLPDQLKSSAHSVCAASAA